MLKKTIEKIVPFTILPIAVFSVQLYTPVPVGNTAFWWLINTLILFTYFWTVRYSYISPEDRKAILFLKLYLIWNIFSIARGLFAAEIYWDYKGLVNMGMALLLAFVAYISIDKDRVQSILASFVKYLLPFSILAFPLFLGSWGWIFFPISLLMLFLPILPIRGKILVIVVTIIAGFIDLGTRSHVIKYGMPIILLLAFYTTRHFSLSANLLKIAQKVLMFIPFLFFVLAVSGAFEIFKMDQYIEGNYVEERKSRDGEVVEENLKADTRTFLYVEVIQSAQKYDYWLIGRTPARGNETFHFATESEEITGRPERIRNEVGVLNVFTWTGIVGVVLFFLLFYQASFLAVYRSNNIFIKLVGLFVAFRWVYSWVEDYQGFDMNNFVIWLMIGMCFSSAFRKMNNSEVKLWAWGIFDKNVKERYQRHLQKEVANPIP
ncbi:hypothetical protein NC99_03250 [Sunxiuqinia dokdonensis]|uniref:Uncharacterized protein n=1 Tax=Sunxiuqinia dokdonensis TaxID=1409788 RepID=A0A0L8VEM2_9BACT|nr:hypothetical protein NC99_03250 [Sunxiuqinia dokdonensis]